MYNLHPSVKIYLLRVRMFLESFGLNRVKSSSLRRRLIFVENLSMKRTFFIFSVQKGYFLSVAR